MKGISLSIETVVLLILMTIVLAALLAFFLGIFNPAKSKFDVIKDRENLCMQYVTKDSKCDPSAVKTQDSSATGRYESQLKPILESLFTNVCNKPSGDSVCKGSTEYPTGSCLRDCCVSYCGS